MERTNGIFHFSLYLTIRNIFFPILKRITCLFVWFVFNLCEETISRTDEGQPRPKYIFNKCGTNIYFFTLQRFGPSPSLNFKSDFLIPISLDSNVVDLRYFKLRLLLDK